MHVLALLLLAGPAPVAAADVVADALPAFARECPPGKPKKRKYDDATFAAALAALPALRAKHPDWTPRAWAVTCEYVILCNQQWPGDTCPRQYAYGQSGPQGTPVNGGELMLLFEVASEKAHGHGLYAFRAKDVGKRWTFYNAWALPTHRIAVIEGPALQP